MTQLLCLKLYQVNVLLFWPFGNLGISIGIGIGISIGIAKILFLPKCFMKNYAKCTQIFFLALSYAASVSFYYNYLFR